MDVGSEYWKRYVHPLYTDNEICRHPTYIQIPYSIISNFINCVDVTTHLIEIPVNVLFVENELPLKAFKKMFSREFQAIEMEIPAYDYILLTSSRF